jgi:hypothetical protein
VDDLDPPSANAAPFSLSTLSTRVASLTPSQRALFDAAWTCLVSDGGGLPIRSIPSVAGKQTVRQLLHGLNGGLIFESTDQGDRYLHLTLHGTLLTGHGRILTSLLIELLNLVKDLYRKDTYVKEIDSSLVIKRLGLEPIEAKFLFLVLRLGLPEHVPISLSSWSENGGSWRVRISDEVIDLSLCEDTVAFLDERLSASYRGDEPCLLEDKQGRVLGSGSLFERATFGRPAATSHTESGPDSFVPSRRLDELRRVSSSSFDCTRLISMCEELNGCATRKSPHAVILLVRAILHHVPPAFGHRSFAQVAASYAGGGSSFKQAAERLENHSRKVADRLTHMPIRDQETAPTMAEVNFGAELETILAEFCRVLK